MAIAVGEQAPDFTLTGGDGEQYTLSDFKGKNVVLIFYPMDFSGVCTDEHTCFVNDMGKFNNLNAQVFGISVDHKFAHAAFAAKLGTKYPLLADFHPKAEVAKKYGVYLEEKGFNGRVNIVLDKDHKVVVVQENNVPDVPEVAPLIKALEELQ